MGIEGIGCIQSWGLEGVAKHLGLASTVNLIIIFHDIMGSNNRAHHLKYIVQGVFFISIYKKGLGVIDEANQNILQHWVIHLWYWWCHHLDEGYDHR